MRRTQARLTFGLAPGAPVVLADLRCRVCGGGQVSIVALGADERGAIELAYCGPVCARAQGWPWLASERPVARRARP